MLLCAQLLLSARSVLLSHNEVCQQCHYGERERVSSVSMLGGGVVNVGKILYCQDIRKNVLQHQHLLYHVS